MINKVNKLKPKIMKKSFLNLRKLGLVLVAAGAMAMYSCGGGEENHDENADHTEETAADSKCEDGHAEGDHSCGEGKCEGGDASEEMKCEAGKCDKGE